jgi:hypothetical protein
LVHLQLAKHAGVAACYPPSREAIYNLFLASDDNQSGSIDENEFLQIMTIACTQISSRIVVYYSIILVFVPYMTNSVIHALLKADEYMGFENIVWLEHLLTYGKIVEKFFSFLAFSVMVPYIFDMIDSCSRQAAIEIVTTSEIARPVGSTTQHTAVVTVSQPNKGMKKAS